MSEPAPRILYLVCYSDEDGDNRDMFVTATSPEEAFVLWRLDCEIDPADYADTDRVVSVYVVPAVADEPAVIAWDHDASCHFAIDANTLALQAIAASRT